MRPYQVGSAQNRNVENVSFVQRACESRGLLPDPLCR